MKKKYLTMFNLTLTMPRFTRQYDSRNIYQMPKRNIMMIKIQWPTKDDQMTNGNKSQ